jgi:DNA-binding transcriptional ArsR family regulator
MPYRAVLEALADPIRRGILFQLREGPASVGELAATAPVTRPAVSRHLRILEQAGLVAYEEHGTKNVYRLDRHGLGELRLWLEDLDTDALDDEEGPLAPVAKRVVVPAAPRQAFEVFTRDIGRWWVRQRIAMECHEGGAIVETTASGESRTWASIAAWEPPHHLAMVWHPGRSPRESTDLDVRFAAAAGQTVVTLHHSGWTRRNGGANARADYEWGWDPVLTAYGKEVARLASSGRVSR